MLQNARTQRLSVGLEEDSAFAQNLSASARQQRWPQEVVDRVPASRVGHGTRRDCVAFGVKTSTCERSRT